MDDRFVWIMEKRKSLPFARKQTIRQLSSALPTDHSIVAMATVLQPLTSFIPAARARCLPSVEHSSLSEHRRNPEFSASISYNKQASQNQSTCIYTDNDTR